MQESSATPRSQKIPVEKSGTPREKAAAYIKEHAGRDHHSSMPRAIPKKHGEGAHNWGGPASGHDEDPAPVALDKGDPMYDDDNDFRQPETGLKK